MHILAYEKNQKHILDLAELEAASDSAAREEESLSFSSRSPRPAKRAPPQDPTKVLYVGNLFFDLTPDQLKKAFLDFGDVINHKIVTDASGMSKG